LATFYNRYDHLINWGHDIRFVPGTPIGMARIPTENFLSGDTYGGEASVTVAPADAWRLTASYSLVLGSAITRQGLITTTAPRHQAMLRSACDFTKHISLDAQLRYVDSIPAVSSYVTADARLSWRPNGHLEVSLVGENLLSRQHFEQGSALFAVASEVPRGFYGTVTWRF
jgi:iron complex outermembrane receptor protein